MHLRNLKKKAGYTVDTAPFYAIFIIAVAIFSVAFMLIVNSNSAGRIEVPEGLETYILYQRFLRSPDCFVYEDISGRAYPLTLDFNKFTQYNIENCYQAFGNKKIPAFKLTLTVPEKQAAVQTDNWNNALGPQKRIPPKIISVYYNNKKTEGQLSIEIQNV
jgi:hypothetical protein